MISLHFIFIVAALIVAILATIGIVSRVNLVALALALFFAALLAGCATQPAGPNVDNAATRTGQNLMGLVSTAMQDYADAKENGVSSLWSISKGLNAYSQVVKTTDDVKQLIVDWKATKGDGNFLQRIAKVLNESDASPQTKALVVAKAAETVAVNKGP